MNFTFHQLRIFLEVVRHQNITRAAEEMYMTQPALSIQLKNFQKQFDVPLIEKVGKKLQPTDFGKSIIEIADNILSEAEGLNYKTKEYKGLITGKLRISSASTGKYVIPYLLGEFVHKYPGIDLKLDVSNRSTVIKQLQNNEIDFALVSVLPEKLEIYEEILLENKLFLIGSTNKIDKSQPLIYREHGSATRNAMSNYFSNTIKRKSIELTSNETVKQAVVAGLGYSIIPLIGMRNELQNKDVHIIPSKGLPILTYWRLIWLKNKVLSPVAIAYLDFIRKEKDRIIKKHFSWYVNYKTNK